VFARHASGARRAPRVPRTVLLAGALVVALALPNATLAGKSTVAPSIDFASVDGARLAATIEPHLGSWVTFSTTYPTSVKNPRIEVLCYQNGQLTFGMAGGVTYAFELGGAGSVWLTNGGEADCTANLYYFAWKAGQQTYNWLASKSFHAGA